MEAFCVKHGLSKKVTGYILHIAEESIGLQTDFSKINLSLSFSEKEGTVELVCESAGVASNPLEEGAMEDDLGLRLIKGRCKSVDYSYENGKNILMMKVKGE
jgi:hypothetical protein